MQPDTPVAGRRRDIRSRFGVPAIVVTTLMLGTCSSMPGTWEQVRIVGSLRVAPRTCVSVSMDGISGNRPAGYHRKHQRYGGAR